MNDTPQNRFGRNGGRSENGPIVPKSPSQAFRPEQGTPPPRRSRAARNQFVIFLNFVLSTVILAVIAIGIALWFGREEFVAPGPAATATNNNRHRSSIAYYIPWKGKRPYPNSRARENGGASRIPHSCRG